MKTIGKKYRATIPLSITSSATGHISWALSVERGLSTVRLSYVVRFAGSIQRSPRRRDLRGLSGGGPKLEGAPTVRNERGGGDENGVGRKLCEDVIWL